MGPYSQSFPFAAEDRSNSRGHPDVTVGVEQSRIWAPGKERSRVTARSLLCYWAVRDLGLSMAELSRRLGLSLSGFGQLVKRGEKFAQDKGYKLWITKTVKLMFHASMTAVTWQLGRAYLTGPLTIPIALISFVLLIWFKVNSTWLTIGGGVIGLLNAVLR